MLRKVSLIEGRINVDARGILRYVNEENPGYYRRFYLITHNDMEVARAWQGHKKEEKAFYAVSGSFTIAVVNPANFEMPSNNERPDFFQLNEENKNFLRVPGGCFTGIKATSPKSTLLVLSSMSLDDSRVDDYRQPSQKWVDWSTI